MNNGREWLKSCVLLLSIPALLAVVFVCLALMQDTTWSDVLGWLGRVILFVSIPIVLTVLTMVFMPLVMEVWSNLSSSSHFHIRCPGG